MRIQDKKATHGSLVQHFVKKIVEGCGNITHVLVFCFGQILDPQLSVVNVKVVLLAKNDGNLLFATKFKTTLISYDFR